MNDNDLIPLGVNVTREQHAKLKALSDRNHVPMGVYLRQALDEFLRQQRRREEGTK